MEFQQIKEFPNGVKFYRNMDAKLLMLTVVDVTNVAKQNMKQG